MIELVVFREPTRKRATLGRLFMEQPGTLVPDVKQYAWICETLEDEIRPPGVKVYGETCIPPGRYRVRLITSARFGPNIPGVEDVPMFEAIRIHAGNYIDDTDGCILVGNKRSGPKAAKPWVGESRAALQRLVANIQMYLRLQPELYIRIENPKEPSGEQPVRA
jgi:hypothetical protein